MNVVNKETALYTEMLSGRGNKRPTLRRTFWIIFIVTAAITIIWAGLFIARHVYLNRLRGDLDVRIAQMRAFIDDSNYSAARDAAPEAQELAARLRDDEALQLIDTYTGLCNTVIRADRYFFDSNYQSALTTYRNALSYAGRIGADTRYIRGMEETAGRYILFFDIQRSADDFAGAGEYEAALDLYNQAAQLAYSIPFSEGRMQAQVGALLMEEEIELLRLRAEMLETAAMHMERGSLLFDDSDYAAAAGEYQYAVDIYTELGENARASNAASMLSFALYRQAKAEAAGAGGGGVAGDGSGGGEGSSGGADSSSGGRDAGDTDAAGTGETAGAVADPVYDHNSSLFFDLKSMIDRQDTGPASLVRMGSISDRNEGWYNGCGWIATYNLLILLGEPRHPADIVRAFEAGGGTVMDGVLGTYPNAIEQYLDSLGFDVRHTLFPQVNLSIDSEIKNMGAGIVAYAHTRAAHYAAVVYRESDGRFVVYNDGLARARSAEIGLADVTADGAVIDSVDVWLMQSQEILFAFSLITAVP